MKSSLFVLGIALLCVLSGSIGGYIGARSSASQGNNIATDLISITDDAGAVRIQLGIFNGAPVLRFFAADGTGRSFLTADGLQIPMTDGGFFGLAKIEDSPSLYFVNAEQRTTTSIGPMSWSLSNGGGKDVMIFSALEKGLSAGFYYSELEGDENPIVEPRLSLGIWENVPSISLGHSSETTITLKSSDEAQSFSMRDSLNGFGTAIINRRNGGSFFMFDEKDEPRLGAVIDSDGPSLQFWDEDGKGRLHVGTTTLTSFTTGEDTITAESNIVMFDKGEKVIWQAP